MDGISPRTGLARVWYGLFFNDLWRSLTNRTADEKPTKSKMAIAVIFAILMSLGVNIVTNLLSITSLEFALVAGLILSVLFVAPIVLGEWIWDKKSLVLVTLNTGFYLIYFLLQHL